MAGRTLIIVIGLAALLAGAGETRKPDNKGSKAARASKGKVATEKGKAPRGKEGEAKEEPTADTAKRPLTKNRPDSLLKRDPPLEVTIDTRGELERRRDAELVRHFTRVAELDVIASLAKQQEDDALMERVDAVRRKEKRRFMAVMQLLRDVAEHRPALGKP